MILLRRPPDGHDQPPRPQRRARTWRPVLVLAFVAPIVAESVASANTPLIVFLLKPLGLLVFAMLYGASALLLREAWVRGRIGFAGTLVAGCAFTVLNEGVVADVLFRRDPLGLPAAALARQWGVNWALVVDLAWFHTLFGLVVPIVLAELTFATLAGRSWLRWRGIATCIAAVLVIGVGAILPKDGVPVPDAGARAGALLLVLVLAAVALLLPRARAAKNNRRAPTPGGLVWRGALLSFTYGLQFFAVPHVAPGLSLPGGIALTVVTVALLRRWTRSPDWTERHTVLLVVGSLIPSAVVSLPKIALLQPLSILAFSGYLAWLSRRVWRATTDHPPVAP